ncbi:hypothetical protein [Paraburkholderia sp. ZP32-5]|nr:hypothetical protein [Paraburkholderia sp. ZP32-5]
MAGQVDHLGVAAHVCCQWTNCLNSAVDDQHVGDRRLVEVTVVPEHASTG